MIAIAKYAIFFKVAGREAEVTPLYYPYMVSHTDGSNTDDMEIWVTDSLEVLKDTIDMMITKYNQSEILPLSLLDYDIDINIVVPSGTGGSGSVIMSDTQPEGLKPGDTWYEVI